MNINKADLNQALVLQKAILKAAELLCITNEELSKIIGVSKSTVSRLYTNRNGIKSGSKEGELCLLFLRVFTVLDVFLGNEIENERNWLRASNKALNGAPIELMKTVAGLVSVVNYLDAISGKS